MNSDKETSLTSPNDRNRENPYKVSSDKRPLSGKQTKVANRTLVKKDKVFFDQRERYYVDPPIPGQNFFIMSFVPSKTAKPDEDGFYGFFKIRGCYDAVERAEERAEDIVRNIDSCHVLRIGRVGFPTPITERDDVSESKTKIDLKDKTIKTITEDLKNRREKEQQQRNEIMEREKRILENDNRDPTEFDELDEYTKLHTKRANIMWTYIETAKKMKVMESVIKDSREKIAEIDRLKPEFRQQYMDKYEKARKEVGITDENVEKNFMKFLMEDREIPFYFENIEVES